MNDNFDDPSNWTPEFEEQQARIIISRLMLIVMTADALTALDLMTTFLDAAKEQHALQALPGYDKVEETIKEAITILLEENKHLLN